MLGNNDRRDIETLRDLPLESMLTSVLNAAIKAQAEAALTTAEFVKQIGFVGDSDASLLDDNESAQNLKVRQAELSIESGRCVGRWRPIDDRRHVERYDHLRSPHTAGDPLSHVRRHTFPVDKFGADLLSYRRCDLRDSYTARGILVHPGPRFA